MSFLRNLLADLVEKRLWPVALALAAALVAVPVLLGGAGAAPAPEAPLPATAATAKSTMAIKVSEDATASTLAPAGKRHNPFIQPKAAKADVTTTPSTTAPADSGSQGGTSGGGGAPATTTPPPTTTAPPATTTPPADDTPANRDVLTVNVRFGEPGATPQTLRKDIARLTALPSTASPLLVFLGASKDQKRAIFLLSSTTKATGDGTCKPSPTDCQTLELKAGETTFLDVTTDAGVRQFQLDLVSIRPARKATAEKAAQARARVSRAGQEYLRTALESGKVSLDGLSFSDETGTLSRAPKASSAGPVGRGAYRVDVSVGGLVRGNLQRLALIASPAARSPQLVYLGVRSGGHSVSFLNLGRARVSGDVSCTPSPRDCRRITLRKGRTAVVGGVRVHVTALRLRDLPSAAAAARARTAQDAAGAAYVAAHAVELGDLALDPRSGTLVASAL